MSEYVSAIPKFGRIPDAERRSGLKRGFLYKLAGLHRGLFVKAGDATLVDLERLDRILAALPAAEVKSAAPTQTARP